MNITPAIATTFGLLAAAMVAAWFNPIRIGSRFTLPPWVAFFGAACVSGLLAGLVSWQGVLVLLVFAALAFGTARCKPGLVKVVMLVVTGAVTLALSLHRFPGFANPTLAKDMQVSTNAPPFTPHLNFDTAAAGLILFAFFCIPARTWQQWRDVARQTPIILGTALGVLLIGVAAGFVDVDVKFTAYTPVFFICNLLFTCITEEAFFRGFIQEQLTVGMKRWRAGPYLALAIAALLFGLAHARGGPMLIVLASVAGVGYGYAYLRSKRIEAAILTHIALNTLHFIAFTYPRAL